MPKLATKLTFLLGLLLVLFSLSWYVYQGQVLSFNTQPIPAQIQSVTRQPIAIRIIFPKFDINQPVIESEIRNGVWEVNKEGASHLVGSANPGEKGNIIIYGHNLLSLFGKTLGTRVGQEIKIITKDSKFHTYVVTKIQTVNPGDVYVLNPTLDETITFYTCTGLLDTQRFVVTAKPQAP